MRHRRSSTPFFIVPVATTEEHVLKFSAPIPPPSPGDGDAGRDDPRDGGATRSESSAHVTRADQLRLVRLIADVAALHVDPARQRQHLINGLSHLLRMRNGWLFAVGNYRPGRSFSYRAQVLVSEPNPRWLAYITDFGVRHGTSDDPVADAILNNPARRQVYSLAALLAQPGAQERYVPAMRMVREMDMRDGVVGAARLGPGGDDVIGFSLQALAGQPYASARNLRLARLAIGEIARLAERGTLRVGPATTVVAALPPRLQQILIHLLDGHPVKQIATDLNLSIHTVREHIQRLYQRFGVTSREEFMARFVES